MFDPFPPIRKEFLDRNTVINQKLLNAIHMRRIVVFTYKDAVPWSPVTIFLDLLPPLTQDKFCNRNSGLSRPRHMLKKLPNTG